MNRKQISNLILERLKSEQASITAQFDKSKSRIGYFYIDDLLPDDLAMQVYSVFPSHSETVLKKSLKEYKHIAVQMDIYNPLLEEIIYAFQDETIVSFLEEICVGVDFQPDAQLYAGGLSMMSEGHFLNPHLDNSHDKERQKWRMLNLLYYVSPNWVLENGGNLELWPDGPKGKPTTILSKFNRLVVMATHNQSWHSVNKVNIPKTRCCVSNYYFSEIPWFNDSKSHVTTFRGRPEEKLKDKVLKADAFLRNQARKFFKKGLIENPHVYKKGEK